MELNREAIIKALECCSRQNCEGCPLQYDTDDACLDIMPPNTLSLIKELTEENKVRKGLNTMLDNELCRLGEENERLKADNEWLKREVNTNEADYTKVAKTFYNKGKADTVRRMQERLKKRLYDKPSLFTQQRFIVNDIIDEIAKEMLDER